ncbi:MAG: hypothetical protein LBJ36_03515 [Synergistaceae bacterium]|jgi:hypothetical protein|nr:hypothetical protein [Synergistaceae bacterium]
MSKHNRTFTAIFFVIFLAGLFVISFSSESDAATGRVIRKRVPSNGQRSTASKTPPIFASGAGTQKSPYLISTAAQLAAFSNSVSGGNSYAGKYIRLGTDIDLEGAPWFPIGFSDRGRSNPFKGIFDGGGYIIWNLRGERPLMGLFGVIDGATVNRINLQHVDLSGGSVGGIAAFMRNSVATDCSVSGSVKGTSSVGGLVGSLLGGGLQNCDFLGQVEGRNAVGGLAGTIDQARIRVGVISGRVIGALDVGGAVGSILAGDIVACYGKNLLVKGEHNVGGLIGNIIESGGADKSTFDGQVTGIGNIGGVAGRIGGGELHGCGTLGFVQGRAHIGGIVGELAGGGVVVSCTADAAVVGVINVGGVVGEMTFGAVDHSNNKGTVRGGEAVGGVIGHLSNGSFVDSRNFGGVNGAYKVGMIVGAEGDSTFVPDPGRGGIIGNR